MRDAAGILDLPGFSRFMVEGPGLIPWLREMITGFIPKEGKVGLAYFADDAGRIVTEMSVARLGPQQIMLITAATAEWHDRDWLVKHMLDDGSVSLRECTEDFACQILTGPKSRDILNDVLDEPMEDLPWLSVQHNKIDGRDFTLFRVSFAGELGWELHTKIADTAAIYDKVMAAGQPHGLKPFGMFALDSLRLEKGYRAWKGDLSTDYTVLQGGLERFVRWSKESFTGKAALEAEKQRGVSKSFCTLTVDAGNSDAPYMSTLWHKGEVVGETTSGGWGHRIDKSIALGMLRADLNIPGIEIEVEIFGERRKAVVQADEPLWDPANERIRA